MSCTAAIAVLESFMSMKEGIRAMAYASLDAMDEVARELMANGVAPDQALLASKVLAKKSFNAYFENALEGQSASDITSGLKRAASAQMIQ